MASRWIDTGSSEHPESSSSSGSRKVPAIFLSHSGKQKPFVERLNKALLQVNHTPFFDRYSLPKASRFPAHIMTAARECTLGVVVLSDDFLTSKWPMLELEILVLQRGREAKVLPLFYKLMPVDLKSPGKLVEWRKKWEEFARKPEDIADWEKAVKGLRSFHGDVFGPETSEEEYITIVVQSICSQVPCPLLYDMSDKRGHSRLAKEVANQFDCLHHARQDGGACMVGLHGVGGAGKSTLCEALVNFYWLEYIGKCHLLELPNDCNDMGTIVQKCKKALEVLVGLDEKLLIKVDNIGQVIQLMREHLAQHDVFLAIDNVWESSQEVVERILKVGFSSKSKILVTSRSEEALKDLFCDQNNSRVGPVPAPDREEAFQIFQEAFRLGDLNSLVRERHLVDGALKRCEFDGTYHALALKAFGLQVKNMCALRGLQYLSGFLREIKNADLPSRVEDVIRRSYDSVEEHKKCIFLDIALLPIMRKSIGGLTVEKALHWMSFVYKGQLHKGKADTILNATIYELCRDGLLQLETNGVTGERVIGVHDLLSDLAESEAAGSSRFFIAGRLSRAAEDIQWQELERVILHGLCEPQFIEELEQQVCPRLQVLDALGVGFSEGIDTRLMPALRVLMLRDVSLRSLLIRPASALAIIYLEDVCFQQPFGSMPFNLDSGVTSLEDMARRQIPAMEGIVGLGTLKTLQKLRLVRCKSLKRIPDLSSLTRLVMLHLVGNKSMEEVGRLSSSLRNVAIGKCGVLQSLPDMSGLTCLETLYIFDCKSLKGIPDLSGLAGLEELVLGANGSMEEVGGWSSSLRHVDIWGCGALGRVPDMSRLTRLETLEILYCPSLKRIPDLSGLVKLEELKLRNNASMEEVGGWSSSLRCVDIGSCREFERLPDMSGLTSLESLNIWDCRSLTRIPDLTALTRLVRLHLVDNGTMNEGLPSQPRSRSFPNKFGRLCVCI